MNKEKALNEFLSPYLDKALEQYVAFIGQECPLESKAMTAYHNACKAALSHVALLMKLMNGEEIDEQDSQNDLKDWIQKARQNKALMEEIDVEFD